MSLAAEAEAQPAGARPTNVFAVLQVARGVIALGGGRHAEAYDQLARLFDPDDRAHHYAERHGALATSPRRRCTAAACARRAPRRALRPARPRTRRRRCCRSASRSPRPLVARPEDAEAEFAAALEQPGQRPTFHRARLLLAQGAWLRRDRRAAESRAPLRAARDLFDALGAVPWAERARQELRASGERSGRRVA